MRVCIVSIMKEYTKSLGCLKFICRTLNSLLCTVSQGVLLQKSAVTLGAVHKNSLETQTETYHLQYVDSSWNLGNFQASVGMAYLSFLLNGSHCFKRLVPFASSWVPSSSFPPPFPPPFRGMDCFTHIHEIANGILMFLPFLLQHELD